MDKKEELIGLVKDLTEDIDDRMENLIAIKGEKFAEAVSMCLAIHSVLEVAGAKNLPHELRGIMLADMMAGLMSKMLKHMLTNDEECKEAITFAKNINMSMSEQAAKISKLLNKGDASS